MTLVKKDEYQDKWISNPKANTLADGEIIELKGIKGIWIVYGDNAYCLTHPDVTVGRLLKNYSWRPVKSGTELVVK